MAKENDMNVSEFIRYITNKEVTNNDIYKNQSYLSDILTLIITNIIEEKTSTINHTLKQIYLKQELIIEILKSITEGDIDSIIKDFTTTYLGENLRTI